MFGFVRRSLNAIGQETVKGQSTFRFTSGDGIPSCCHLGKKAAFQKQEEEDDM